MNDYFIRLNESVFMFLLILYSSLMISFKKKYSTQGVKKLLIIAPLMRASLLSIRKYLSNAKSYKRAFDCQ